MMTPNGGNTREQKLIIQIFASLCPQVVSRSRSRSSGSSRSSSRSSRSSSNSSVERKADKEVAATPAMEGQPRSSVSPTKAQRSKSPGQQRKSRSRSQSKGKNVSHPSPSRKVCSHGNECTTWQATPVLMVYMAIYRLHGAVWFTWRCTVYMVLYGLHDIVRFPLS